MLYQFRDFGLRLRLGSQCPKVLTTLNRETIGKTNHPNAGGPVFPRTHNYSMQLITYGLQLNKRPFQKRHAFSDHHVQTLSAMCHFGEFFAISSSIEPANFVGGATPS